ncbi:MAG: hypothetical protein Q9M22_06255 [Mariprofundaceae bacterium]|nr:hypothetical protein [Mariprofundaceae bacterium]
MKKRYFTVGWLLLLTMGAGLAHADACMIEGDLIKVTARIWNQNDQWMAQLEKPVCILGVSPDSHASYKISDTVMLIKLNAADEKARKTLKAADYARALIQGVVKTDHQGNSRIKCSIVVSDIIAADSGTSFSEVLQRGNGEQPWVLRAKEELNGIFSHDSKANTVGQDALKFVHPLSNYQNVADWSVADKGKNLVLTMRIAWKGKILQKLYYTEIEWRSNKQGHIAAEIIKDGGKLHVTNGKIEKMDNYFRTQIWPTLYSKLK